ncbi:MAG: YlbF family regulator [Clostridiales bacterium]|jgi:cell fate (sporulation/competence/biofilm development) regulator YlbF (YheA/YmcA/DUF963 family)|nr:YlbF family regulator [Clostridiales bacterium]
MIDPVAAATQALVQALQHSEEYAAFVCAREKAFENAHNKVLYLEYRRMQTALRANVALQTTDHDPGEKLRHITELLHFEEDTSALLLAEYRLNRLIGGIFHKLAAAVGIDVGVCEG